MQSQQTLHLHAYNTNEHTLTSLCSEHPQSTPLNAEKKVVCSGICFLIYAQNHEEHSSYPKIVTDYPYQPLVTIRKSYVMLTNISEQQEKLNFCASNSQIVNT